jgi:hypothetical protein
MGLFYWAIFADGAGSTEVVGFCSKGFFAAIINEVDQVPAIF